MQPVSASDPARARLIPFELRSGNENMAADELLLDCFARSGRPVLRLYGWRPPAVSLGRYQRTDCLDIEACQADGVDIVRRITGGGAIYHDAELTYAVVCADSDGTGRPPAVAESYTRVNDIVIGMYRALGVDADYSKNIFAVAGAGTRPFCFSGNEEYDICAGGKKIGGNAQKRVRGAILQHGSIPRSLDRARIQRYFRADINAANFTALEEITGRAVPVEEAAELFIRSFEKTMNVALDAEAFQPSERETMAALLREKYLTRRWNYEGRTHDHESPAGVDQ